MTELEELDGLFSAEEVADPRPLRRLALGSGLTVVAVVVTLVVETPRRDLGVWIVAVWVIGLLAALLLLGALAGLWGRHVNRLRPDPDELRERQVALRQLTHGELPAAGLMDATQRVVEDQHQVRWLVVWYAAQGVFWVVVAIATWGDGRWRFWLYLGMAVSQLALAAERWRQRSRVLGTAARGGIRPQRRAASGRRGAAGGRRWGL